MSLGLALCVVVLFVLWGLCRPHDDDDFTSDIFLYDEDDPRELREEDE